MPCKIINNSGLEIPGFEDMIQSLVSFSQDRFGFEKPPTLFLNSDLDNATNLLGKTAYYDPEQREIHVYTTDRHPKDIMRSISHELVHHHQNCKGDFAGDHYSGEGYAQKDPHMRKMEKEAYLQGNMCFRDWEDSYKQEQQVYNEWRTKTMSLKEWKNKELFNLLSQRWGFSKNVINEGKDLSPEDKKIAARTEPKGELNKGDFLPPEARKNIDESAYEDAYRRRDALERKKDRTPEEDAELAKLQKHVQEEQLDEDKESFDKIQALEKKRKTAGLDDKEREELKLLKKHLQMDEQKLDEEEVDETVRAYASRNAPHFTKRDQNKIRESIYDRFRKLIK